MEKENNAGRPKACFDLEKDWQVQVLKLYSKGASDVEIKALIYRQRGSFSNDLWDRWIKEEPEFSETIKLGKMLSEAWWTKKGRSQLSSKNFSYTGWFMNMRNRFNWSNGSAFDLDLPEDFEININIKK